LNPASNILGVSPLPHDSSAALVRDGVVVAAIENDKLVRMRSQGMPDAAIAFCLRQGHISSTDLDCVAIANRPALNWVQRALGRVGIAKQLSPSRGLNGTKRNSSLELSPAHGGKAKRTIHVDHHLCHAASAFFQSPFERALIVVMDEGGDGRSGLLAIGEGNNSASCRRWLFPTLPRGFICRLQLFWASCPAARSTRRNGWAWKANPSLRTFSSTFCAGPAVNCRAWT
jgi:carbamoyltransferase